MRQIFLPCSYKSILLTASKSFKPLESNNNSEVQSFLLERLITVLQTKCFPLILLLNLKLDFYIYIPF